MILNSIKKIFHPWIITSAALVLYVVLFITNGVPFIYSDGFGSFHTTQCILNEGSFACSERPYYFSEYSSHTVSFFEDKYVTVYAPGSALLQLPGQFIAQSFTSGDEYSNYFIAANGHSMAQGTAFLVTSMIVSFLSFFVMYKSLRNFGHSKYLSSFSLILAYSSSYAIWYVFLQSGFNHSAEILGIALQTLGLSYFYLNKNKTGVIYTALGVGLAVISRPPLVVSGILIGIYFLYKRYWEELAMYVGIGLPFAALYLAYNKISYNHFFSSSYELLFNQNFQFDQWNGIALLFSPFRGWFVYSPLFLLSIIGLILFFKIKKYRAFASIALFSILFTAFLYGFWPTWWGGGTYGQRFMISFVPFLAVGTAQLIAYTRSKKYSLALIITMFVLALFSVSTTLFYRLTPVADLRPRTENVDNMSSGDRYKISDIYGYHLDLIRNADSVRSYLGSVANSVTGGHSYLSLNLGFSKHVLKIDERSMNGFNLMYINNPIREVETPDQVEFIIHTLSTGESMLYKADIDSELEFVCEESCIPTEFTESEPFEERQIDNAEFGGFWLQSGDQIFIKFNDELYLKGIPIRVEPGVNFYPVGR